ncbi:MAG: MATE family efflux transporter [Bacteroidaceae bacterium]|nr:MATE family efflux transporter [Bacteroidaceae bacterium]
MNLRDRQILHIALPSIVSNITVPLLGLIDVAITGHLGSAAYIGAIAVGGMLFNIIYWMFAFLRMGTSGMTSQAFGARDLTEVVSVLLRALFVSLGISVLMLCLQVPVRELSLYIIMPSEEVAALTRTYYNICIWGAPAALSLFVLTGWYVGMQNSKIPMAVAIIQNVANIVVSLLFVYGCGMKIEGVALGTVIAQYIGLGVAVGLLFRNYSRLRKYLCRQLVLTTASLQKFFLLNKDIFLRTCCLILVHFFFISAGAKQGDTELAVNTILMQLFTLYSYIMDGFAFAGEAMVGKAIGAKMRSIYDDTVRHLFRWGWALAAVFTLAYVLFGNAFLSLLTDDATVLEAIHIYQPWTFLFPLCGMAAFIWDGIYIGATATKGMLISMASGMAVFFLLYVLLVPLFANHGLWIAFICYLSARGISQTLMRQSIMKSAFSKQ